ncbi:MAG: hypothetical protein ACXV3U_03330 [Halobacteriota archaeon]
MSYISIDKPGRFFVSRLEEDTVIAWKGSTMVVFPRQEGRWYAVGICIARRVWKVCGGEMLA